jgi:hypothetical protein
LKDAAMDTWFIAARINSAIPPLDVTEGGADMTTFLVCAAIYFAIPLLATGMAGRQYTWQGHLLFFLFWPVAWLFMGPEELP